MNANIEQLITSLAAGLSNRDLEETYLRLSIADALVKTGAPEDFAVEVGAGLKILYQPLEGSEVHPDVLDKLAAEHADRIAERFTMFMLEQMATAGSVPTREECLNEILKHEIRLIQCESAESAEQLLEAIREIYPDAAGSARVINTAL